MWPRVYPALVVASVEVAGWVVVVKARRGWHEELKARQDQADVDIARLRAFNGRLMIVAALSLTLGALAVFIAAIST